jgi:hypothetical protein
MYKQDCELGYILPTAMLVFHHQEEGSNLPTHPIPKAPCKAVKQWRAAGERIILFMDHNKHVIKRNLGQELVDRRG